MISKELLREVLGSNRIHTDGGLGQEPNLIHFGCIYGNAPDDYYDEQESINIYELTHECEIWAAHQNFKIESQLSYGVEKGKARLHYTQQMGFNIFRYQCQHTYTSDWFECNSKPEAIFTACEWILKQQKETSNEPKKTN